MSKKTDRGDVVVVGLGAVGSAAAYHLARRGRRVIGLEAFVRGHTRGAHHGESRIIRLAYFEGARYVPLLRRAYVLWEALERDGGEPLLHRTGGLFMGPPDCALVTGSISSALAHELEHEVLDPAEIRRHYPVLEAQPGVVGVFERAAGILLPERAVAAHLRLAERAGADLRFEDPVVRWSATAEGVEVVTASGRRCAAEQLVLAAGAWMRALVPDLAVHLIVERIPVYWVLPRDRIELFDLGRLPIFLWETGDLGEYYGFPHLGRPGVKVARHHSDRSVDPDTMDRTVRPEDEAHMRLFVRRCIPALDGPLAATSVCMYTTTPDEHFILDRHPLHPAVTYFAGDSGHAFKLSAVLGEIIAGMVTRDAPAGRADFLRASRFDALTVRATSA